MMQSGSFIFYLLETNNPFGIENSSNYVARKVQDLANKVSHDKAVPAVNLIKLENCQKMNLGVQE